MSNERFAAISGGALEMDRGYLGGEIYALAKWLASDRSSDRCIPLAFPMEERTALCNQLRIAGAR
jgi:hypothetical protein